MITRNKGFVLSCDWVLKSRIPYIRKMSLLKNLGNGKFHTLKLNAVSDR